jgi:hypothetical protein
MQTSHSEKLHLLGTLPFDRGVENILHKKFQYLRINGEWYQPHPDLIFTMMELFDKYNCNAWKNNWETAIRTIYANPKWQPPKESLIDKEMSRYLEISDRINNARRNKSG